VIWAIAKKDTATPTAFPPQKLANNFLRAGGRALKGDGRSSIFSWSDFNTPNYIVYWLCFG